MEFNTGIGYKYVFVLLKGISNIFKAYILQTFLFSFKSISLITKSENTSLSSYIQIILDLYYTCKYS